MFELTVFLQPVLGGHPVLSNHLAIPQGCLLNKGWTVYTLFLKKKKKSITLNQVSDIQTCNLQFSSSTLETMKERLVTEEASDPWQADQDELARLDCLVVRRLLWKRYELV